MIKYRFLGILKINLWKMLTKVMFSSTERSLNFSESCDSGTCQIVIINNRPKKVKNLM